MSRPEMLQGYNACIRVCIIDDDYDLAFAMEKYLSRMTLCSIFSWTDKSGMRKSYKSITDGDYDLFIIDLNLAGISGNELGDAIRMNLGKDTPIIYISQDKMKLEELGYIDQDNSYFLPKPIYKDKFVQVVNYMSGKYS